MYIVAGDDQNLLREVFDRVNSAGKPMTRAEVFHALFAGGEAPERPNFSGVPEAELACLLAGTRGRDGRRRRDARLAARRRRPLEVDQARQRARDAAERIGEHWTLLADHLSAEAYRRLSDRRETLPLLG